MVSVGLKWFLVPGFAVITSMCGRSVVLETCTRPPILAFILRNSTANCNVPPKIGFISTTHFYITVGFFLLQSVSSFRFPHNIIFKLI